MSALEIATTANAGTANFFAPASSPKPAAKRSQSPPTSLKSKISSLLRRSPSPPVPSSATSPPPYSASTSPTGLARFSSQVTAPTTSSASPTGTKGKRDESKNINFFLLASGYDVPA